MLQKRFLEDLALTGLTLEKKTVEQKLESGDSNSTAVKEYLQYTAMLKN